MLKANVGLSRKISRDYNSTGYSVNLDGEILVSTDDPEAVTEKIKELFSLAHEALAQEIDRDQGDSAIGRRDEEPPTRPANGKNGHADGKRQTVTSAPASREPVAQNGSQQDGHRNGNEEAATNKQIQFILTMGKRFKLSTPQLEGRVVQIVGRQCRIYDLTKKEAGRVLDQLTNNAQPSPQAA